MIVYQLMQNYFNTVTSSAEATSVSQGISAALNPAQSTAIAYSQGILWCKEREE